MGEPAQSIVSTGKKIDAGLIVMATHARHGLSRFFLGSVAEVVLREAACPVLTIRGKAASRKAVAAWMTHNPVVASLDEKLASVEAKMHEGDFRAMPVLRDGAVAGIITDRDLRPFHGRLATVAVKDAMTEHVITITGDTPLTQAARLLRERKIGGVPVVEAGKLIGMFTITDLLQAFTETEAD
jgi:acetoin utilization protein AcuB